MNTVNTNQEAEWLVTLRVLGKSQVLQFLSLGFPTVVTALRKMRVLRRTLRRGISVQLEYKVQITQSACKWTFGSSVYDVEWTKSA
jgi:hypothetical protein